MIVCIPNNILNTFYEAGWGRFSENLSFVNLIWHGVKTNLFDMGACAPHKKKP